MIRKYMNTTNSMLTAAIGGLLVMGIANANATAADMKMEKCYGIAKAGKNDCAGKGTGHSCAGQASSNSSPKDFVGVPKGTCDKIANGIAAPADNMMSK